MTGAKPTPPPRPTHGFVKIGNTSVKVRIDWDEYNREKVAHGKVPRYFTVHGFHKSWRVSRDRLTFAANPR